MKIVCLARIGFHENDLRRRGVSGRLFQPWLHHKCGRFHFADRRARSNHQSIRSGRFERRQANDDQGGENERSGVALTKGKVTCYIGFMLTRRTNVLFSEGDYLLLKRLSAARKVTVASLIREAIRKTHKKTVGPSLREMLAKSRRIGSRARIRLDEWKEFINEGRKL